MTASRWASVRSVADRRLSLPQRWAIARDKAEKTLARIEARKVDYIQDPETGRLMGSHPSGGDEGGATAPAAEAADKPKGGGKKGKAGSIADFSKVGIQLDNQTVVSAAKRDKFIERWNTHVQKAPEDFHKEFLGGLKSTMNISYRDYAESLEIRGDLLDEHEEVIGNYTRIIDMDDKTADSNYFKLYNSNKGGGIGKQMLAANVEMYRSLGITKVSVHANIDVGGYAWARYGYVPTQASWDKLRASLQDKLTYSGRERPRGDTQTPGAWDEMSNDQQEEIEGSWITATHDEFLDSEIDIWRDSGDALDQAKSDTADKFDGPPWPEWATASVAAWREQYKDDHDGKDIPFSDKEILSAISVEYETGNEGRADPKISFDDSVLDKADVPGFDPKQQTLPGIEPKNPHELLTQVMREDIETELTSRFNREANDVAADMEAPNYLSESVRETQSDYWDQMENWQRYRWARDNNELPAIPIEPEEEPPVEVGAETDETLRKLLRSRDPKAIWAVADSPRGKDLLLNSDWAGVLDMNDKETMARFEAYVAKGKTK